MAQRPPAPVIAPLSGDIGQRLQQLADFIGQNIVGISVLQDQVRQLGARQNAAVSEAPANPAGTTSATNVLMGFAASLPVNSSRIIAMANGQLNSSASTGISYCSLWLGTGTAPVWGAPVPSGAIRIGQEVQFDASSTTAATAFSISGVASGLTPGTPVWLDMAVRSGNGTASVSNVVATAFSLTDAVTTFP